MPQLTDRTGSRSRRRGEVLERALYEATLAELTEVGYGGLTMEGIAARAHTGKAALYRRWDTKCELVHAALVFALPPVPEMRAIFADAVVRPRLKIVESILQSAVQDGDLDPKSITPLTARIGSALINQHFLLNGSPPNRRELALIVDTVIPPRDSDRAAD